MPNTQPRRRFMLRSACGVAILAVAVTTGMVACGGSSGDAAAPDGTQVTSVSTRTITSSMPTANPAGGTPPSTAAPGPVRLVLGKTQYHPGDLATVTIENGLSHVISTTDHHSSCSLLQLEKLVNGAWQPIGKCNTQTPTRIVELAAGSATQQQVGMPTGTGVAGTYRMMLTYGAGGAPASDAGPAYSSTFTVA